MTRKKSLTAAELAATVGCRVQNIYVSRKRGNLIADERGRFDMAVQVNSDWLRARREGPAPAGREARPGTPAERKRAEDQRLTRLRRDFARMKILEAQALAMTRDQIPVEVVEEWLFKYCDELEKNILAMIPGAVDEAGETALLAGRILPEIEKTWTDHFLQTIDSTKKSIIKKIQAAPTD
ncbi:MAG TPA: hypothetical protein PKY31_04095 [Spirochaetota bacterium]|nr:hypothetical protein [Spirochaetota bacterium]